MSAQTQEIPRIELGGLYTPSLAARNKVAQLQTEPDSQRLGPDGNISTSKVNDHERSIREATASFSMRVSEAGSTLLLLDNLTELQKTVVTGTATQYVTGIPKTPSKDVQRDSEQLQATVDMRTHQAQGIADQWAAATTGWLMLMTGRQDYEPDGAMLFPATGADALEYTLGRTMATLDNSQPSTIDALLKGGHQVRFMDSRLGGLQHTEDETFTISIFNSHSKGHSVDTRSGIGRPNGALEHIAPGTHLPKNGRVGMSLRLIRNLLEAEGLERPDYTVDAPSANRTQEATSIAAEAVVRLLLRRPHQEDESSFFNYASLTRIKLSALVQAGNVEMGTLKTTVLSQLRGISENPHSTLLERSVAQQGTAQVNAELEGLDDFAGMLRESQRRTKIEEEAAARRRRSERDFRMANLTTVKGRP